MTTRKRLTTKTQALRAFRGLLVACDMGRQDYVNVLRRIAEHAEELADDEMIAQRIYAIQARKRAATT
jgi:hypothetical protein